MGFFDLFKKKGEAEEQPQSEEQVQQGREELNAGLEKTKSGFFSKLARAVAGRTTVDADVLDDLEEVLITSDVGVETTVKIIEAIEERVARDKYMNTSELQQILRDEIARLMEEAEGSDEAFGLEVKEGTPYVLMVVGVNGAGKTTTIGKLAAQLTKAGKKVYIGAADTFRAAAIDQLAVWAERAGATMIRQEMGSDPASVAFDTLKSAVANGADVVLIDTAGRLHNKVGLMNELTKIRNVMAKVIPDAPHEVMLVLDGSTGQNAFVCPVTGACRRNLLPVRGSALCSEVIFTGLSCPPCTKRRLSVQELGQLLILICAFCVYALISYPLASGMSRKMWSSV